MKLLRPLRNELLRLLARKRTHLGFVLFPLTALGVALLLQLPRARLQMERAMTVRGFDAGEYFSGLTLATIILSFSFFFIAQLFIALVGGDIVAKDVEDGTLRLILSRPVTRGELLWAKWLSALGYAATLILFIGLMGWFFGGLFRGFEARLFVFHPGSGTIASYSGREAYGRYLLAVVLLGGPALLVASLSFMFSCFNLRPAAATILTLAVLFADFIISNIPYLSPYRERFMLYHIESWIRAFMDTIPWWRIGSSFLYMGALALSFFIVGAMRFHARDFK